MYIDAQQQYSQAQAVAGPGTVVSTNAIDHTSDRNFGIGKPMAILINVLVGAAGGGTLTVTLQADTTSAFGSAVAVAVTSALAAANLTAGTKIVIPVPPDLNTARWSRLQYVLATMTGITLTAQLVAADSIQNEVYYPAGTTIQ